VVAEDEDEDEEELQAVATRAKSSTPHAPVAFRVRLFI
jgi:hypothetical protein